MTAFLSRSAAALAAVMLVAASWSAVIVVPADSTLATVSVPVLA